VWKENYLEKKAHKATTKTVDNSYQQKIEHNEAKKIFQ
jgi:hypothetical protein